MKSNITYKNSLPNILTLGQTCKVINCHPNTLRNWDNNGTLKAIRFGARRDRRYHRNDILALIEDTSLSNTKTTSLSLDSIYEELSSNAVITSDNSFSTLVNFSTNTETPLHGWFKYREGYSSKLVESFIKDEIGILDPFCGSGTTMLTAKKRGVPSWGFEINPLSSFVSKVKLENYSVEEIGEIKKNTPILTRFDGHEKVTRPGLEILDRAFNKQILITLLQIKSNIEKIQNNKVKNFFCLAWLIIIESVSNTYKEGNGIKYRTTKRTPEGYVKINQKVWEDKTFGTNKKTFVTNRFNEQIENMLVDLTTLKTSSTPATVYNEDAKTISKTLGCNSISLTIFSPPYANCFDYFETYKIELWLGGFIKSYEEMRNLRYKALRSNLNTNISAPTRNFKELEQLISHMDTTVLWDSRIPAVLRGYFSDMEDVLRNVFEVTKHGGRCVMVVGNSAYGNVIIPTDLLLYKIAKEIGFSNCKLAIARHLTTSSQQKSKLNKYKKYLRESIIILEK